MTVFRDAEARAGGIDPECTSLEQAHYSIRFPGLDCRLVQLYEANV